MPSQIYPESNTLDAIGSRLEIPTVANEPTLFIPFPRKTFPSGPNITLMKIRGIVFRWSLGV